MKTELRFQEGKDQVPKTELAVLFLALPTVAR